MSTSVFIEPLDVLLLRGNKLFGDPGSFGEALIPPWPSVAAGALRSRMLADDGVDLAAFSRGEVDHPSLGTPAVPGAFTVAGFHLARRHADGRVELLMAPPADLVVFEAGDGHHFTAVRMAPMAPLVGLTSSAALPLLPVLAQADRRKPAGGYWLTESGYRKCLAGRVPDAETDWVKSRDLWRIDQRVGVGLDAARRRAQDGQLFSMQAVALAKREHGGAMDVGFLATVRGAAPPTSGLVRLGGDGRAAALHLAAAYQASPDYVAISTAKRCRLLLTSPGLFDTPLAAGEGLGERAGWLPSGANAASRRADGAIRFDLHGVSGWLVCAAVPRAEVVSGWDLARWQPKDAQRAAPTGSVWWLDELDATPEALRKLAETGLWREPCDDAARRAEGFNRIAIAAY